MEWAGGGFFADAGFQMRLPACACSCRGQKAKAGGEGCDAEERDAPPTRAKMEGHVCDRALVWVRVEEVLAAKWIGIKPAML